jgi:hypothetical protein
MVEREVLVPAATVRSVLIKEFAQTRWGVIANRN